MIQWNDPPMRSLLLVPGNDARRLADAGGFGADAIFIDLEDAVAEGQKIAARDIARAAIPSYDPQTATIVRVNGITTGLMEDDIAAVVRPELGAIIVPKIEDVETLTRADAVIAEAEAKAGMKTGRIRLLVLLETALGLARCEDILLAAPERVYTTVFGTGDFTTTLGVDLTADATEILYARSRIVVATRAAGLAAPIDGPWRRLQDFEGLELDCQKSRQLGFQGRVTAHPPQVEPIQRHFAAMSDEDAGKARRIVEAFEDAKARGIAPTLDGSGIDYPIYRLARERIRRYDALRANRATAR